MKTGGGHQNHEASRARGWVSRAALLAILSLMLSACDNPAVRQRAENIKRDNEALDRKFSTRAAQLIRRRWIVEGDEWYGRLPNGGVIRVHAPEISVEPLHVGRPFYTGWAGDVTLSAETWETRPATRNHHVLTIKYRATFKDLKHCEIAVTDGPKADRPTATDTLAFR